MKKFYLIALFFLLAINAFSQQNKLNVAIIGFYNLENFYDTIDDPITDDAEFLPNGIQNWNTEKYITKLDRLSEVISRIGEDVTPGGPVILGLSEVENRNVLEDLISTPRLKPLNYGIVHYNSPDRRGVDVAMIYQKNRFVVEGSKPFRLTTEDTSFRTRDQLLVWGKLDGEPIHILVNHWPSRRGGEARSAPKRRAAAALSRKIIDSLLAINPNMKFVLMGDLNDNPNNKSVKTVLDAKLKIEDVKDSALYNPMYKLYVDGVGTYAYRDSWDLFDQIIVTPGFINGNNKTYTLIKAKIFNQTFLKQKTGTFQGYPWRTAAGGEYLGGYSDHFPVYAIFGREPTK